MNNSTITWMLAGAISVALVTIAPVQAQSTLGGAKPQQNKIGGVAKPAPVIGGTNTHNTPPTPPKPGVVANVVKPATSTPPSTGATTPSGPTTTNTRPNPSTQSKGTGVANLKCAAGACTSKGTKP